MPEADFRALNGIPPHMLIKSGSALLVPRTARMEDDVSPAIADNGRLDLSPEAQLRRLTVKAKPQDSLDAVAARYKVTAAQLADEWRPWIDSAISAFGAQRCMFESNFPVDRGTCDYATLWNAFKLVAAGASADEKTALFSGTAARVYRLAV
jgi:hypothetical protein